MKRNRLNLVGIIRVTFLILSFSLLKTTSFAGFPTDSQWNSISDGWSCVSRAQDGDYTRDHHEIDCSSSTPGPNCSLKIIYPAGWEGGAEPYHCWNNFGSAKSDIWIQYYFKFSSGWTPHGVIDKLHYVNIGPPLKAGGDVIANNGGKIQFRQQYATVRNLDSNTGYDPTFNYGQWYKLKVHMIANTAGNSNGKIWVWINDELVMYYDDVKFIKDNEAGQGFMEFTYTPIWGGVGSVKPKEEYLWFDETIIQSTDPGGSASNIKTPMPPASISIE